MSQKNTKKGTSRGRKHFRYASSVQVVLCLLLLACTILAVRTRQLHTQTARYEQMSASLDQQITDEKKQQDEIQEKVDNQNSKEYIEELARQKLGLIYGNEIIFKKK